MVTTIQIDESLKNRLNSIKIHKRETYNDLILRLVHSFSPKNQDKESLVETIEILSDPEIMRGIAKGIDYYNKGKFKTLKQVRKEIE
ncbi:MAG: antitoxin VapB family protein [Nanoarchaeota archaeon]